MPAIPLNSRLGLWRPLLGAFAVASIGCGLTPPRGGEVEKPDSPTKADHAFELFRREMTEVLHHLEVNPTDPKASERNLRAELYRVVDRYALLLRAESGTRKYVSADKSFILVIGSDKGEGVSAKDDSALLVVAIAGGKAAATAWAGNGIAVAVSGQGAWANAVGGIGGVGIGGVTADGTEAAGSGIDHAEAIVNALRSAPRSQGNR
jgi:hypothetical protein